MDGVDVPPLFSLIMAISTYLKMCMRGRPSFVFSNYGYLDLLEDVDGVDVPPLFSLIMAISTYLKMWMTWTSLLCFL